MHSIIKNLSKVLALTVLSTNFSSIALASSPASSLDFPQMFSSPISTDDPRDFCSTLIACNLTRLATYNVFATDDFKTKVDLDIQLRILRQLNVLIDDYPLVFARYFSSYLKSTASRQGHSTPGKFMIDVVPTYEARKAISAGRFRGGRLSLNPLESCMRFNCTREHAAKFRQPPGSVRALPAYQPGRHIEYQVAHEFGHCIQNLFLLWSNKPFEQSPIETKQFIQSTLAHENLANRLGTRWQEMSREPADQAREFFADFFAYVHCGEDVPTTYKAVLNQVINRWFPIFPTPMTRLAKTQSTPASQSKKAPGKKSKAAPPKASPNHSTKPGPKKGSANKTIHEFVKRYDIPAVN